MKNLADIAQTAMPGPGIHFRRTFYGSKGVRSFLRDVIAMANASIEGERYIVVGVDVDEKSRSERKIREVPNDDFAGKPSYQSLVSDFIEPPIRVKYRPVNVGGKRIGIFEIGDCQDRPYMMRVDHCETLRRGDAYARIQQTMIKMGRKQLQTLFERKFRESVSAERIEIGFPGEIIHKEVSLPTVDLATLPSALATSKLKQLIEVQKASKNSGSTSVMSRMMHARLFGADIPYENRTAEELMHELAGLKQKHHDEDLHFLFEENARKIQLVVYNQGDEPIRDASLSLALPNHDALHIASHLPKLRQNGHFVERRPNEQSGYPTVNQKDDLIKVSHKLGEIPASSPVQVFTAPLRLCAGKALEGRRIGIRYRLSGQNLRKPVEGNLRILL